MSETDDTAREHLAQFNEDARKLASIPPMTAPTPEQMRALADQPHRYLSAADRIDWMEDAATALRAAADEVDRLRGSGRSAESWFHKAMQARIERNALRAAIEDAPHDRDASCGFGYAPQDMSHCKCWKADAL
ncbi:hypothetical protein QP735_04445 [Curtobacterium citreum]|uniref:hypothetical protein n=1 Tax=Curtobacterium citreum TaxID=2036 RepID=UPI00254B6F38|nr:hypothetical protein [Curtobacterium citreum]MDK8171773.1 hypothetical protein [Curtobacterium citreum]